MKAYLQYFKIMLYYGSMGTKCIKSDDRTDENSCTIQ